MEFIDAILYNEYALGNLLEILNCKTFISLILTCKKIYTVIGLQQKYINLIVNICTKQLHTTEDIMTDIIKTTTYQSDFFPYQSTEFKLSYWRRFCSFCGMRNKPKHITDSFRLRIYTRFFVPLDRESLIEITNKEHPLDSSDKIDDSLGILEFQIESHENLMKDLGETIILDENKDEALSNIAIEAIIQSKFNKASCIYRNFAVSVDENRIAKIYLEEGYDQIKCAIAHIKFSKSSLLFESAVRMNDLVLVTEILNSKTNNIKYTFSKLSEMGMSLDLFGILINHEYNAFDKFEKDALIATVVREGASFNYVITAVLYEKNNVSSERFVTKIRNAIKSCSSLEQYKLLSSYCSCDIDTFSLMMNATKFTKEASILTLRHFLLKDVDTKESTPERDLVQRNSWNNQQLNKLLSSAIDYNNYQAVEIIVACPTLQDIDENLFHLIDFHSNEGIKIGELLLSNPKVNISHINKEMLRKINKNSITKEALVKRNL